MSVESADSIYAEANKLHVEEEYDSALDLYNEAIQLEPKPEFFSGRAANFLKLKKYAEALSDLQKAIGNLPENANLYFRQGTALFNLDHFESAKVAFTKSSELGKDSAIWIRKCDAEIARSKPIVQASESSVAAVSASADDEEYVRPVLNLAQKMKEPTWLQSAQKVTVTVYAKDVAKESVVIRENELLVRVMFPDDSVFEKTFELAQAVVPAASSYRVSPYKVEISLVKAVEKLEWLALEKSQVVQSAPKVPVPAPAAAPLAYPTSSKVKRDWGALEQEVNTEEKNEKPSGEDALNHLFKQIYKDASEETRRAMVKSYQTSGGTVLSTNWDEVSKTDYENQPIQAPKGAIAKKWNE